MKHPLLTAALLASALATQPAWADLALAKARNCMACHALDRKVVGPSYKDIAARYKGDAQAAERLAGKIRNGSSRAWGAVDMPANGQVSEADAKKLAAWVLGQ